MADAENVHTLGTVPNVIEQLAAGGALTPAQFFAEYADVTPEQKLCLAMLDEAFDCLALQHVGNGKSGSGSWWAHRYEVAEEARLWMQREDRFYLHGFGSLCDILGVDASAVRRWALNQSPDQMAHRGFTLCPQIRESAGIEYTGPGTASPGVAGLGLAAQGEVTDERRDDDNYRGFAAADAQRSGDAGTEGGEEVDPFARSGSGTGSILDEGPAEPLHSK